MVNAEARGLSESALYRRRVAIEALHRRDIARAIEGRTASAHWQRAGLSVG
jgi:hypothetical protein